MAGLIGEFWSAREDLNLRPLTPHGRQQFAKLMGQSFITDDGEAIEGKALDGVTVHGVLTYTINRLYEGRCIV